MRCVSSAFLIFRRVKLNRRLTFSTTPIIGTPSGSTFEVHNDGTLVLRDRPRDTLAEAEVTHTKWFFFALTNFFQVTDGPTGSNEFLNDSTTNQKLSGEAIAELKRSGVDGDKLIETLKEVHTIPSAHPVPLTSCLAQSSESFQNKTEFSQAKYVARKQSRHSQMVIVELANARTLAEHYFSLSTNPLKTLAIRSDTLAQVIQERKIHRQKKKRTNLSSPFLFSFSFGPGYRF